MYAILLIFFPLCIFNFQIISFNRKPLEDNFNQTIDFNQTRPYYTEMEIGNPPQIVKLNLGLQTFSYYILSSKSPELKKNKNLSSYDPNSSNTFELDEYIQKYLDKELEEGGYCYDDFKIGNSSKVNIPFLLAMGLAYISRLKINAGILGLAPEKPTNMAYTPISFLSEIKGKKLIESKIFFFDFSNEDKNKGEMIIGVLPESYNNNTYSQKILKPLNIGVEGADLIWGFPLNELFYGNEDLNIGLHFKIIFNLEEWMITGPIEFNTTIYERFFKEHLDNQRCQIYFTKSYSYYVCDKNINTDNFKPLNFFNKELQYNFTFTDKDLFFIFKDKLIFKVQFPTEYTVRRKWIFGSTFLSKYTVLFNQEAKTLGFYLDSENKSNIKPYRKNKSAIIILSILLFISISSLVATFWYIHRMRKLNRKKRATEIEDDFYYELGNKNTKNIS